MNYNQEMLEMLKNSPSAFHAIEQLSAMCDAEGFEKVSEHNVWKLKPEGKYYVTRNHSAIIAFKLPAEWSSEHFQMSASHSDSPCFKLKPNGSMVAEHVAVKWNVEMYGGATLNTWFDRPLSVAGRIYYKDGESIREKLVNIDKDFAIIPNMPPHLNRQLNDGYKFNLAVDLVPVIGYGDDQKDILMEEIEAYSGVSREDIVTYDLYLYLRQEGTVWAKDSYVSCGRLDDLQCAYTTMKGFLEAPCEKHVNVCCVFDNEEVGSSTAQGAMSTFLLDTLRKIARPYGREPRLPDIIVGSFMVSADNAQACHPNHPEYFDASNRVFPNGGPVIKYNASQAYTSDAISAGVWKKVCEKAHVPTQDYTNRSDLRGGSTLGHISLSQVSVPTVDVGLAQWAMHSAYETAGALDTEYMVRAMRMYYTSDILITDGTVTVK